MSDVAKQPITKHDEKFYGGLFVVLLILMPQAQDVFTQRHVFLTMRLKLRQGVLFHPGFFSGEMVAYIGTQILQGFFGH